MLFYFSENDYLCPAILVLRSALCAQLSWFHHLRIRCCNHFKDFIAADLLFIKEIECCLQYHVLALGFPHALMQSSTNNMFVDKCYSIFQLHSDHEFNILILIKVQVIHFAIICGNDCHVMDKVEIEPCVMYLCMQPCARL